VLSNAGPGLSTVTAEGHDTAGIARAAAEGELSALYLLHVDPLRDLPGRGRWEAALDAATTVVAHAAFLTEGLRQHATVVFPAESYAEKDGTVVHPDGRVQRLRPAIGHPGEVRYEWQVLGELSRRLGLDQRVLSGSMATKRLVDAVPFYAGLTLDEIGGRGVRWQDREPAGGWPEADVGPFRLEAPVPAPSANGSLRLGVFRSIWASPEVEASPALSFLAPRQRVEIAPDDARRLGVRHGDRVTVGSNGTRVHAVVTVRGALPPGTVFLQSGTREDSATALDPGLVEVQPV
jgi:NADH-quinone oxidoreductase subunit G